MDTTETPPFSLLNEDGSCADEYRVLIPDDDLVALLETMLFNRVLDQRLLMLQRQGRIGFYLASTGEEAAILGASYPLTRDDPVFLSYRELGVLLWREVDLTLIVNQLMGNSQDLCKGRQMPVHYAFADWNIPSVSSPVGTQLPHACGFAYAAKLRRTGQVALAFLGEGTASQGDFHTALNFSGAFLVPAIFVIRNNGYAISTPETVQTRASSLASRAAGYGIAGMRVDGNDLLAMVEAVRQAVERARNGGGPTLIEALTYRLGAHSTADDPSAYRDQAEAESWLRVDALPRLRRHAMWRGVWREESEVELRSAAEERISRTIAECEKLPPPRVDSLFEDVYEGLPEHLEEQRNAYTAFLRRRSEGAS